eukprot:jgi/Astpho2/39/Aster-07490
MQTVAVASPTLARCTLRPASATLRPSTAWISATRPSLRITHMVSRPARRSGPVQTSAAMELYQLAGEGELIGGTAAVMFAITLVGLAIGFVLLRVEALVEEGKI